MTARDPRRWRVIDTGLRGAASNIALNRAILEAHEAGGIPHTLRFLRFQPSALLGFHQNVDQELRLDYCREQGIEVQRRITGGGALYFDATQIGWELYVDKRFMGTADMTAISRRICEAAADGIRRLGVDARFRPRNDIEVDGRKISGTGGAFDGDSILFQGTLLVEFDVARMLRVLRIPAEKLSDKAIASARDRVANLAELLGHVPPLSEVQGHMIDAFGDALGVDFEPAAQLSDDEQVRYREALSEINSQEWVFQHNRPDSGSPLLAGVHRGPGGLMRAHVAVDHQRGRIKQLWITGDFFVNPRRMVPDLEAALRDTLIEDLRSNVHGFFDAYPVEMLMLQRGDFVAVIENALAESGNSARAGGQGQTPVL
ncbi:MAG TPA: biotin/lipoate A/B protein ligase family protein [Gammaproteobacteria bacterium]|nr:biotin/lipoate A/B protein ligase family protein [Gammaproteobacteria bacterium]